MIQIISYVALALAAILLIVGRIIAISKNKKKCQELEAQKTLHNQSEGVNQTSNAQTNTNDDYKDKVLIYTFIKLKEGHNKVPTNKFLQVFFDELQTFPENSKLRKAFADAKNADSIGFDVMGISMTVELSGRRGFMGSRNIKLKNYFNFSENDMATVVNLIDDDAKALAEKVVEKI